ncbi:hypothetical protein BKA70DRAFT_1251117 [Coprinopsis sp. MPI-PUGE-AT-0042]|nr:hypothetical protein BKA70DRAFT_1251117 [Coprinopsis sp. MPI-PUGE-AT-0042]
MPLHFKLKFGTETRRCTFPEPPSWDILATKLHTVFGLPKDSIAVSYLDAENDEITLSSEEELQDYYLIVPSPDTPDQTIKLNVIDLSSRRERNAARSSPKIPLTVFELEESWQPLPPFHSGPSGIITSDTIPASISHAFIEVLDTDPSAVNPHIRGSDSSSTTSTPQPSIGKGKGRLEPPTPSRGTSTQSILDDDAPDKYEIHVMDRSLSADQAREDDTDPPLPDLSQLDPSVTLTQDIASLLDAFNGVVTTSPELVSSLRRLVVNARRGTYWEAHRENLSRTVSELSQAVGSTTAEFRRNAEAEAARRISESLGGLFRTLSVDQEVAAPQQEQAESQVPPPDSVRGEEMSSLGGLLNQDMTKSPPFPPDAEPGIPSVPLHATDLSRLDTTVGSSFNPPAPPKGPPGIDAARRANEGHASEHDIWSPSARPAWLPPPPPIRSQISQSSDDSQQKPSPQELRASVEAAKAQYKAEKERYRKEREERKRIREERKASGSGSDAARKTQTIPTEDTSNAFASGSIERSTSQLVSNARGTYPRLEMFSVAPAQVRRSASSGNPSSLGGTHQRSYNHIVKKLAEMGFPVSSYPEIVSKVTRRLPSNAPVNKEEEDDIATVVLEELLADVATKNPTSRKSPETFGTYGGRR